jgi:amino acid adenylation domain-containing protein
MVLMTAFDVLLWRYTGQEDLLVGTPVANRGRTELEGLIGQFVNTLVLRSDLSGNPTVREMLARVRELCLDAYAHQELPFETLVQSLRPERDMSRNPLYQVMLVLQNLPQQPFAAPGLTVTPLEVDRGAAHLDLTLYVQETPQGLRGTFEYATDLFEETTIARMARHWRTLLEAMIATPGCRLLELPLLTDTERQQLLVGVNSTNRDYARKALTQELFETQTARAPDRTALRFGALALSYAELDARANCLAHILRSRGVGRGQRVGLCMERSAEMLAAVLGILKAGAAYVPLDPSFPEERLRFMAEDAQLALLVSTAALAGVFGLPRERQLLLDTDAGSLASQPDQRLTPDAALDARPEDPAYVIYTSGSTGKPKGVVVPHRAVVNFLTSMARVPGLAADDVLVAVTTLSFDIAVLELQLPLTVGATVVIASRDEAVDGHVLKGLLEQHRATVMQATPVTWRLLLEAGWQGEKGFKALVGGETLPKDLADQLIACGVELWNLYGPTETTVWSTCARITDAANGISIGRPIANTTVYVLDAQNNLCPIGVPGELCIGGVGVTLGYWKRPELTAERFIPDPFSTAPGATLYRTGDRARWRNDGTLEHLGRLDFQVKIRGFRIELGEIETNLANHPAVRETVVIARENVPGDQRLVAYLVTENPPADLIEQLRALTRTAMPEYMVPAHFVRVDALPRTHNGKLNRKALPAPQINDRELDSPKYVAPRTETEKTLAVIWAQVLGLEQVGVEENFFALGGHSLLAMQIVSRVRQACNLELPLRELFIAPKISALAMRIETLFGAPKPASPTQNRQRITI